MFLAMFNSSAGHVSRLAQGILQVIGATTSDEYHRYVEADEALERCFHPFLFEIDDLEHIRLDWENVESCWVAMDEIINYPTVPKPEEALQACLKTV